MDQPFNDMDRKRKYQELERRCWFGSILLILGFVILPPTLFVLLTGLKDKVIGFIGFLICLGFLIFGGALVSVGLWTLVRAIREQSLEVSKVKVKEDHIMPSWGEVVIGILGFLVTGLFFLLTLRPIMALKHASNSSERGWALGELMVYVIFGSGIFKWSRKRFYRIPVTKAVSDLAAPDANRRRWAANALKRFGWNPPSEEQRLLLLVAEEKWDDALSMGEHAVPKILETLNFQNSSLLPKLDALRKSRDLRAIKPLIELMKRKSSLGHRKDVANVLKELTGRDFGTSYDRWLEYFNTQKSRLK